MPWAVWAYLAVAVILSVWPITQFHNRSSLSYFRAAGFAVLVAICWPLIFGGAGAFYLSRRFWRAVLG